ncbi:MAG: T9SS type A sorting domain-containing protein, partial [Candidatus Kapaibacterium sp.]
TYTGDSYHNYYTKLHWPRAIDTITIDVVAVGNNAPPFDNVKLTAPPPSSSISVWPNPASRVVHLDLGQRSSSVWISDALGRIVRKENLTPGTSTIDISDLSTGLYDLFLPGLQETVKLQILR